MYVRLANGVTIAKLRQISIKNLFISNVFLFELQAKEPKIRKNTKKPPRKINSSGKCVVGDRVLVSNKHISIEKTHKKSATDNRSRPPPSSVTIINKPAISVSVPSHLPPFHKNNIDASDRSVRVPTTDGKEFRRKIDTGEITIVPINSSVSPTNRPSTSPKISPSIEIRSIIVPKSSPLISSLDASSITPPGSSTGSRGSVKRIAPLTVSHVVSKEALNNDSDAVSKDSFATNEDQTTSDNGFNDREPKEKRPKMEKTPLNEAFTSLLNACREADRTKDMEDLIRRKLIRYYQGVHPEFVNSKSFCKTAMAVATEIRAQPSLVYIKIKDILEELNIRRKSTGPVATEEEVTSTGDARKDYQIRKLNRALYLIKKQIAKLEEAEVNFDDEHNSAFMIVERYKKRGCEIYSKICDITGESKNAQRLVKKPIKFNGTKYTQFNRTLQTFVNDTQTFPDMFDVLRCLEHCNRQHNYGMSKEECKKIGECTLTHPICKNYYLSNHNVSAQDAFLKIGEVLQKRRKTDLYETASYFTGTLKDPALEDMELATKLSQNQKYHDRMKEIFDKYVEIELRLSPSNDSVYQFCTQIFIAARAGPEWDKHQRRSGSGSAQP